MATVMKSQGYATGQFGKNHQGDRDEHLPTMHGFDKFLGNLYHLNAEEEPENEDYPGDMMMANGKTFRQAFGPRGVLRSKADGKGGQTIEAPPHACDAGAPPRGQRRIHRWHDRARHAAG
jgi:arylsulfatase